MLYSEANPEEISQYANIPVQPAAATPSDPQIASQDSTGGEPVGGSVSSSVTQEAEVISNNTLDVPDTKPNGGSQASKASSSPSQDKDPSLLFSGLSSKMAVANPPEDLDHSKAPLIEHLIELRRRLMYCIGTVLFFFIICYIFAQDIYNFLLIPYKLAVGSDTAIKMIYTAPQEFFFTKLRLALFGAIALSFPVIAAQLYMFVAPGLYKKERQAFLPFLVATPVLFILGGALVFLVVMPLALQFFLSMQQTGNDGQVQIELTARVSEYLHFVTTLILGFGICFQLPVLLTLLARVGLVSSTWLRQQWRYAVVVIFAVAAFLTPPDLLSQTSLAIPTLLLYELSIFSVRMVERQRARERAAEDINESNDDSNT